MKKFSYKTIIKALTSPKKVIWHFIGPVAASLVRNDKLFIKVEWFFKMSYPLDLDNPRTINEKIQWLKLNDRNPAYTIMVDKFEMKNYIHEVLGPGYTINTIGVWDSVDDIPWEQLPRQFVLKCTHDSHGIVICRDKESLNIKDAVIKLRKCLKTNYYLQHREWPYKDVKPRVICEEYKEDPVTKELTDYKFYMFNGRFKLLSITTGRKGGSLLINYYDDNLQPIHLEWGYECSTRIQKMPVSISKMIQIATLLSKDIPFLRVDFYEIDSHPVIGELTFYDGSGYDRIEPFEMDLKLGDMLTINANKNGQKEL